MNKSNHQDSNNWKLFTVGMSGMSGTLVLSFLSIPELELDGLTRAYWSILAASLVAFATMAWLMRPVTIRAVVDAPAVEQMAIPPKKESANPYTSQWVAYWLSGLTYSEQVGSLVFAKMRDFAGNDYETWHKCFVVPLRAAGYLEPLIDRKATQFTPNWNPEKVRWRLESGVGIPPTPDYAPPEPHKSRKQQADGIEENTMKTETNTGNSGTVSYARDA